MPSPEESPFITVEAAAKILHIGRTLAYDLARQRQLPGAVYLGRRVMVNRKALLNAGLESTETA